MGLVVADWRYAVRVANIAPGADLKSLLSRAIVRLPNYSGDRDKFRPTIYVNSRLLNHLPTNRHCGIFVRAVELREDEPRVLGAAVEAA
jgi:hypothetical protein